MLVSAGVARMRGGVVCQRVVAWHELGRGTHARTHARTHVWSHGMAWHAGQVRRLVQHAQSEDRLCKLFSGWAPWV